MLNVILNKVTINKENKEAIILKDISFHLEEKNIYTILGKNGSGKSTLLKSLTSLFDKRFYSVEGSVFYKKKDLLKLNDEELSDIRRNEIRYVFQDPVNSFDHLKTFEYYFKNFFTKDENYIKELLNFFLLPDLQTLSQMYPYEVSGGMAQRINLVLALAAKPKIIFLDEPTSGIDAPIANLIILKLKEFVNEGNIVLLVTHDIDLTKKISSKIALLSDSALSGFYSPEEFFHIHSLIPEV